MLLFSPQHTKAKTPEPWDLLAHLKQLIEDKGGPVCCHAHFDKAYVINQGNLHIADFSMEQKWDMWQAVKKNYTMEDVVTRMSRAVENLIAQGCKAVRTFVDVDATVGLLCVEAALTVKNKYKDRIDLQIVSQVLEGALSPQSQQWIEAAAPLVDVIGALPSRDRPRQAEHLDYIFGVAKRYSKPVDVHIDQNNDPDEYDTELLALKTIEHGLIGRVNAIHACSLSSHSDEYIDYVCGLLKKAEISVVVSPRAMLDGKQQRNKLAPIHNSIAPVEFFMKHNINVAIGVDNIYDYFCPFADGNIFTELTFLLETCRIYNLEQLTNIATTNGNKIIAQCHDIPNQQYVLKAAG